MLEGKAFDVEKMFTLLNTANSFNPLLSSSNNNTNLPPPSGIVLCGKCSSKPGTLRWVTVQTCLNLGDVEGAKPSFIVLLIVNVVIGQATREIVPPNKHVTPVMQKHDVVWEWEVEGKVESWQVPQRKGYHVHKGQTLMTCIVNNKRLELLSPATGLLAPSRGQKTFSKGQQLCQVIVCPHTTHFGGMLTILFVLSST